MFDCADVQQRPPLAKGLVDPAYNQIAAECPECRPIIDRLRERMDGATSLELELAHLVEVSNESPERRRQLTAFRFYLRRVIEDATIEVLRATSGYTRYLRLMNSLYDWHRRSEQPIRIVTFNYDVILEDTLQSVFGGWDLRRELARFIERDDCRLFKLHGSVGWSRVVKVQAQSNAMMLDAAMTHAERGGQFDGEIEPRTPPNQVPAQPGRHGARPSRADGSEDRVRVPARSPELPPRRPPHVKHVLIVGWRAAEPHALELFAGSNPQEGLFPRYALGIVNGSPEGVEEVKANLGAVGRKGRLIFEEPGGFSVFIQHLDEQMERFRAAGWD